MNRPIILFITAAIAVCLTACWGTVTENVNTEIANSNKSVADLVNASANAEAVNNSPSNPQNTNRPTTLDVQSNKVGKHVKSGKPGIDLPEMKKAENIGQTVPAPENSVVSNEMNIQGNPVQTRKFNDNPTIDKLEVITFGEKQTKQLLYLKNGRVLEIANGAVANPIQASSYTLLKAVGIELKNPETPNNIKKQ